MTTIHGTVDGGEVERLLEVEVRGDQVFLRIQPPEPEHEKSGQQILVGRTDLVNALSSGHGQLAGISPVRGTPKQCEIEDLPEGLLVKIHPESGKGTWWVSLPRERLRAVLADSGA